MPAIGTNHRSSVLTAAHVRRQRGGLQMCTLAVDRHEFRHRARLRVRGETLRSRANSFKRALPEPSSAEARRTSASDSFGGLPILRPRPRAAAIPARVRSPMRDRSNSASAPMTWKRRRPLGDLVSIASDSDTRLTPRPSSSEVREIRWARLRPRRSSFHVTRLSPACRRRRALLSPGLAHITPDTPWSS
jgi:hypothetical protein